MMVIQVIIGALRTIDKGQDSLEIKTLVETIQTTELRSARIPRKPLETWEDLLSLRV